MPHFVYDETGLSFPKTDDVPLGIGDDPTKFVQALDWNLVNQAAMDLRDVLLHAKFYGMTAEGVDPTPAGVESYLWPRTDNALLFHNAAGETHEVLQSSRPLPGPFAHTGSTFGALGATPITKVANYTINGTYPATSRALAAYSPSTQGSVFTGIDNAQGGTPYAKLSDLNALRASYEVLRAAFDNLAGVFSQEMRDFGANGAGGYGFFG